MFLLCFMILQVNYLNEFFSNFSLCVVNFTAEDNSKNVLAQHLVTEETTTASMGELNQIINLDGETVCVKFSLAEGKNYMLTFIFFFFVLSILVCIY